MKFDTSLFEKNDKKLAKQVKKLSVVFDGVEDKKLTWIDAKSLVKKYAYYLKQIDMLANTMEKDIEISEDEFHKVYDYLIVKLNETKSFRKFMQIVKAGNMIYGNEVLLE